MNQPDPSNEMPETGFEKSQTRVGETLGSFIPQRVARRAISATVTTDKRTYSVDEPVRITVEFRNRLPVPVPVETETPRVWGWTVDGRLSASDEKPHLSKTSNRLDFRASERKKFTREWSGRFKRTNGRTRWEPASPGTYTIRSFLGERGSSIVDETTIRIE